MTHGDLTVTQGPSVTQRANVTIKYMSNRPRRRPLTKWSLRGHASIVLILFIAGPTGVIHYKTIYIRPLALRCNYVGFMLRSNLCDSAHVTYIPTWQPIKIRHSKELNNQAVKPGSHSFLCGRYPTRLAPEHGSQCQRKSE